MEPTSIAAILKVGEWAINRIWPDPAKQAEEQRKLAELAQTGDLERLNAHVQLMLGQIETNKIEAQHRSIFVAGWRPWIGWVAGVSLALVYIPKAIVLTIMWVWQCYVIISAGLPESGVFVLPDFPDMGVTDIIGLLGSMLGIGVLRTREKEKGVHSDCIKQPRPG